MKGVQKMSVFNGKLAISEKMVRDTARVTINH